MGCLDPHAWHTVGNLFSSLVTEVIDRPIFLRRQSRDRDWDQTLNFSGAVLDTFTVSRLIDTRGSQHPQSLSHPGRTCQCEGL
jgi:hypothetical protein